MYIYLFFSNPGCTFFNSYFIEMWIGHVDVVYRMSQINWPICIGNKEKSTIVDKKSSAKIETMDAVIPERGGHF